MRRFERMAPAARSGGRPPEGWYKPYVALQEMGMVGERGGGGKEGEEKEEVKGKEKSSVLSFASGLFQRTSVETGGSKPLRKRLFFSR